MNKITELDTKVRIAYELVQQAQNIKADVWLEYVVFSWRWWVGIGLAIIPWIVWIIFRKKDSTHRLLFVGLFVILISSYLDFLGVQLGLWRYKYEDLPTVPAYMPWDISILPVLIMFILQYKPHTSPLIKALLFAAFTAFFGEPITVWLEIYEPITWKSIYSFPIYIVIYLISHYLSRREGFNRL